KTTVSAAITPKPTAAKRSLLRAGLPKSTHLTPGPRAFGPPIRMPNGDGPPALRKRVLGSREARDVGCLLGDEFEERRLALAGGGDAALDRLLDLAGFGHPLAVAAEGLGEIGVMAADVGRAVFLGRHRHDLQLDRHREIIR